MTWNKNMDDAPRDGTDTYCDVTERFITAILCSKAILQWEPKYKPALRHVIRSIIQHGRDTAKPQPPEVEG